LTNNTTYWVFNLLILVLILIKVDKTHFMKNLTLFLIAFMSFSFSVLAQNGKVVLCEDYNKTDGTPSGINKNWDVDQKDGSYVYIVYSQDYVIKDRLMLYVDKKNTNGSYVAFDTQEFTYNPQTDRKKWAMYDYKFTESGDYRISVMGKGDDALAITYTNIGYMKDASEKKVNEGEETDTYYYEDARITLGESVDANAVMQGEATQFRLIGGKRDLFCKIEQDKALKCKEIVVSVYYGEKYDELVSEETFSVGSLEWDWIKVPITVKKVGKYVVDVYNGSDTFINSAYFEITK